MAANRGRPKKNSNETDTKKRLTEAAAQLIASEGIQAVTVRNVVKRSGLSTGTFYHHFDNKDDLLMYFVKTESFCTRKLKNPVKNISARITELYMCLTNRYKELGIDFMKCFYTTDNKALCAYMGEASGEFLPDTIMFRCEEEIKKAIKEGALKPETDAHLLSQDICTIVKGCVFDWCLSDGITDPSESLERILRNYFAAYI